MDWKHWGVLLIRVSKPTARSENLLATITRAREFAAAAITCLLISPAPDHFIHITLATQIAQS
jgi:hypothetical protein